MTTTFHKPNLTTGRFRSSHGHSNAIVLLAGGLGGDLNLLPIHYRPAACIMADVPQEVSKSREILRACQNVHYAELGQNQTTKKLMSEFIPDDHPIYKSLGSCVAQYGMGQIRGLGRLAALQYLETADFNKLADEIRTQYLQSNGGMFPPPSLHEFGSMNGGVGAGTVVVFTGALRKKLAKNDVPIEINLHLVDSTSYIGLGQSIELNCAATIDSVLDAALEVNQDPYSNCVINPRFISLPPTGSDRELRKSYAQLESQAWLSEGLQEWLQIVGPNAAHRYPMGNAIQTNCEFFSTIPTSSIVNEVVRSHLHVIDLALRSVKPRLHTVRHIDANIDRQPLDRANIEDLLASSHQLSPDQFLQGVQEQGARIEFDLELEDIRGRSFQCSKLPDYFVSPSESLVSAVDDITTVLTIRDKLVQEQAQSTREEQAHQRRAATLQPSITKILSRPARTQRGKKKRMAKLRQISTNLRTISDRLREVKELSAELKKCIKIASDLLTRQRGMIDDVLKMLGAHKLPLNNFALSGLVYFEGTNDVFGRLLAMLPMSKSTQAQLLATTATAVTEEGLKFILRTNSADPHHLAAVVVGPAFTPGAWIGGLEKTPNQTLIVFPRMAAALGESLQSEIRKARPDWLVFFTDSCALGANVVRINVCYPQSKADCLPGYLGKLLREHEQSPLSILNKISPNE